MKQTLGKIRRACEDFDLIKPADKVTVGVSGGKDSMLLLTALARYRSFSNVDFTLSAVCIDMGFGNTDFEALYEWCETINVPLHIEHTKIAQIVFDERGEKNPCALCANLRRGAINNAILKTDSHTLALGHHADDLAETLLMGMLFEGRINTFKAKTFLDRKEITVIRPLIYMREKDIVYAVNRNNIPVIKSACPVNGLTSRTEMKKLMENLRKEYPGSDERIINSAMGVIKKML